MSTIERLDGQSSHMEAPYKISYLRPQPEDVFITPELMPPEIAPALYPQLLSIEQRGLPEQDQHGNTLTRHRAV